MIVLGLGTVGKAICKLTLDATGTSRNLNRNESNIPNLILHFDLQKKASWNVVEQFSHVVWTFPCAATVEEKNLALEFYSSKLISKQVVVFGTTSCYSVENSSQLQIISENSPLHSDIRTQTESDLRALGANIFCLAGLWSDEKLPLQWLERGLIKNTLGCVNLIHTSDISKVISLWRNSNKMHGERLNISSGTPFLWKNLIQFYLSKSRQLQDSAFNHNSVSQTLPLRKLVSNILLLKTFPDLKNHDFKNPLQSSFDLK